MTGAGGSRRPSQSRRRSTGGGGAESGSTEEESGSETEGTSDPCEINSRTELSNTNPDALDDVNIADVFPIELRDGRPCVVDFDDRIIGSILGPLAEQIEDCIEQGYEYQAEIISIQGRNCEVRVSSKCPINARTTLDTPNPDVIDEVSEGDEFDVLVREGSLCIVDGAGQIVGALAEGWTGVIIQCISSGWEYQATILEIDGGHCEVRVQNTNPPE